MIPLVKPIVMPQDVIVMHTKLVIIHIYHVVSMTLQHFDYSGPIVNGWLVTLVYHQRPPDDLVGGTMHSQPQMNLDHDFLDSSIHDVSQTHKRLTLVVWIHIVVIEVVPVPIMM